jgi:hypothetical protein
MSVDPALAEAKEAAIRLQLNRVLSALKIDPWDVLNVPYTATESEIAKAYRNLSLSCHPDKVSLALKDDAQSAFAKLAQAKQDLSEGASEISFLLAFRRLPCPLKFRLSFPTVSPRIPQT